MRTSIKWTEKELDILSRCYTQGGANYTFEVLRELGFSRTKCAIKGKAFALGLKSIKPGYFYKGMTPHNKGRKMSEEVKEKISHTWFRKGHEPRNTKHDGHISVRKDKRGIWYQHIRIEKGKYIPLHRKVWVDNHGEIPKDRVVVFRDGNTMDCRIENLECITKAVNLKRNQKKGHPAVVLDDSYVASVLKRRGINAENITTKMIELKKKQLLLNRKISDYETKHQ